MNVFVCTGNEGKLAEFSSYLGTDLGTKIYGVRELETATGQQFEEADESADHFLTNAASKLVSALRYAAQGANLLASHSITFKHVLVDDSGLCVPALKFAPGVHSATYGGLPRSDERNRKHLRDALARTANASVVEELIHEVRLPAFFVCFLMSCELTPEVAHWFAQEEHLPAIKPSLLVSTAEQVLFHEASTAALEKRQGGQRTTEIGLSEFIPGYSGPGSVNVYFGYCCGEVSTLEQNLLEGVGHGYDSLFYSFENPLKSFASIPMEVKNKISHRAHALDVFAAAHKKFLKRV